MLTRHPEVMRHVGDRHRLGEALAQVGHRRHRQLPGLVVDARRGRHHRFKHAVGQTHRLADRDRPLLVGAARQPAPQGGDQGMAEAELHGRPTLGDQGGENATGGLAAEIGIEEGPRLTAGITIAVGDVRRALGMEVQRRARRQGQRLAAAPGPPRAAAAQGDLDGAVAHAPGAGGMPVGGVGGAVGGDPGDAQQAVQAAHAGEIEDRWGDHVYDVPAQSRDCQPPAGAAGITLRTIRHKPGIAGAARKRQAARHDPASHRGLHQLVDLR